MSKTAEIRALTDRELDLTTGGYINCTPPKATISATVPQQGQYQDPFADHYHIGRYTPT